MPVGEHAYEGRQGKGSCVHGECMAQVLVEDAQKQDGLAVRDLEGVASVLSAQESQCFVRHPSFFIVCDLPM